MEEETRIEAPVRINISHNGKGEISREVTVRAESIEECIEKVETIWKLVKKIQ